ncbi:MAG: DUF167 domain-containing protein [Ktedonobacteraceae bacterium]|nr:DUF167 domain-containing protein [Ktedonobacteraceae bacterium]
MLVTVRVIPRSSKNILEWEQGTLKARLTAPPVDGAANAALISLLAERLAVPRRTISIVRGETSRQKTIEIAGLTLEEIERRLQ